MPPTDVPSALGIIDGRPAMTAAAAELLVPKSIPMIFGKMTLPLVTFSNKWNCEAVQKRYGDACVLPFVSSGGFFGLATITIAVRSTFPFSWYPLRTSSTTVFSGASSRST